MKKTILYFIICLFPYFGFGDEKFTVSGIVLDDTGEPMPYVTVMVKGSIGLGKSTDDKGNFTITAKKNDVLVFVYVGYKNEEFPVEGNATGVKINMTTESENIEEVVVTSNVGGAQRKISVVSAVSSVDVKELQVPATSISNMIGGRVAGVITQQFSGEAGQTSQIWVRGISTFGAKSSALVLIDGIEGSIDQVDPQDIESFSVLLDASATAIYGVRGSNGVVLITTKRGEEGKLKITFRANGSFKVIGRIPKYLRAYDYASLANEARIVRGNSPIYEPFAMEIIKGGLDQDIYPDVSWQDQILKRWSMAQSYFASAQGGNKNARYYLSLSMNNEGNLYKTDANAPYKNQLGFSSYTYRTNVDMNLSETTTLYFGVDGYISQNVLPGMAQARYYGGYGFGLSGLSANTNYIWESQATLTPLTVPVQFSTGQLPAYGTQGNTISPYVLINHMGRRTEEYYKNLTTIRLSQDFGFIEALKGLTAKIQGSFDNQSGYNHVRSYTPALYKATGRAINGELQLIKTVEAKESAFTGESTQWRRYFLDANINYTRVIADRHRIGAFVYYYQQSDSYGELSDGILAIPYRNQGISGKVNYSFADAYFIDLNGGYTGSENFERGAQWGFFPSLALGWVPTSYQWVKENVPFVNFFKIRGSIGQAGSDRLSNRRFPYLDNVTIVPNGTSGSWSGDGVAFITEGAKNLKWEISTQYNLGLELKFWEERFNFVFNLYRNDRDRIFQPRQVIPDFAGVPSNEYPFGNVGAMQSWGSDGNGSYTHIINKDMLFTIRGNYTIARNKVTRWEEPTPAYPYLTRSGYTYDNLRGYVSLGYFRDSTEILNSPPQFGSIRPGDIRYKDVNGDGKITEEDKVPLAFNSSPQIMYGFGAEFVWKNFSIGCLFRGARDFSFFYGVYSPLGYMPFHGEQIGNVLSIVNESGGRWTPAWYSGDPATENPNARFPRLTYGSNTNNTQPSTHWLGSGNYLRFQELSLSYRIKNANMQAKTKISAIDIQLIFNNLGVWDNVKLWDPESASGNGTSYPIPFTTSLQLYIHF